VIVHRSLTLLAAFAASLALLPGEAAAQNPQTREGFFIGLGLGAGSFGCEDCGQRESGVAGHLKAGSALSPKFLVGAEARGWTKEEDGARITHGNLSAIVQFYPSASSGFFLEGGIGLSRLGVTVSSGGFQESASDEGLGLTAGIGFDFRVRTNVSLSPYLSYARGDFEGGTADHVQLGLGVTWH
jgi:opacity protein-like surface antigen